VTTAVKQRNGQRLQATHETKTGFTQSTAEHGNNSKNTKANPMIVQRKNFETK